MRRNDDTHARREGHWFWDAWPIVRRELCIAATVAGSLTIVLLARRWVTACLGEGLLNAEIFAGSTVVNELVGQVEQRVRSHEEDDDGHQRRARRTRAQKRGSTHGTGTENGNDA